MASNKNTIVNVANGWLMLLINLVMYVVSVYWFIHGGEEEALGSILGSLFLFLASIFVSVGYFIVPPNYAGVLVLFGRYKGTVIKNGFCWTNPLMQKIRISLRIRNQETSRIKVNEKSGNPIEIAAVVVWKVVDPYKAEFEVDAYTHFVTVQSESALRHLATNYAYDGEDHEVTLRGDTDTVNEKLREELEERLSQAGVRVLESRLSHLAYAPEIAAEMLRRQQATAVVAARKKIVEGAVGMVEDALTRLSEKNIVRLDEERKASMVSNLLVVLCSDNAATPVVNTGTLYQ
jgi:regulator of protease activity HflC (stomatin/prohibitin superfamily)